MKLAEVEVRNETGLHARPAAVFARAAAGFTSSISVTNLARNGAPADAKSLIDLLSAGVEMGDRIRITAEGSDEQAAVETLAGLVAAGLGARETTNVTTGVAAAPGIAVGPIWRFPAGGQTAAGGGGQDAERLIREASRVAAEQLASLAERLHGRGRAGDAEILEAQALMAVDPVLIERAIDLALGGRDPVDSVETAAESSASALDQLDDELLAARAADVRDVAARLTRILESAAAPMPPVPSIVVAGKVPPSFIVEAPPDRVLALALVGGTPTDHAVILARGAGVPVVVAAEGLLEALDESGATEAAVDGEAGEILLDPDEEEIRILGERRESRRIRDLRAAALRDRPAATADGVRVTLLANVRSPQDAERAKLARAEGIGLFRTEYLFLRRSAPPTEEEQIESYRRAMAAFAEPERPVVVRLADIGGDKPIPYLGLPSEPNPFLGVRAIRLAEQGSRELLLTQLRAIWRAAGLAGVTPHVMAPMVSTIADARLLLELRDEARGQVVAARSVCPERMATGIMIEVPAAAILAPELARLVDFFSIGTNDLPQYVLAADRGNPSLARFQDALHPAVLRTIAGVVAGADAAGIPVAVCGELAGDPAGALVLVGLGVDQLSAEIGALDHVRAALAGARQDELRELAGKALAATDAETVRQMAGALLARD